MRIFNGCEVRIENSVTRVTVIQSDGIFNLNRTTVTDSFSCILFLWQLHLGLNMCCFVSFTLK